MDLNETNMTAARIMFEAEEKTDVDEIIGELIDTSWGGSNDSQAKAMELLKGLAFSDDPKSNKFMAALDKFTSGLDAEQFTESILEVKKDEKQDILNKLEKIFKGIKKDGAWEHDETIPQLMKRLAKLPVSRLKKELKSFTD